MALRRVQHCSTYFNWSAFEAITATINKEVKGYCVDSNRFFIASLQRYADFAPFLTPSALHLYAAAG